MAQDTPKTPPKTLQDPQRSLQDASRHLPRRSKTLQRRLQGQLRHFKDGPIHLQEPQDTCKRPPTFNFFTKNQKCLFRSRHLSKNTPQDTSKDIPKRSKDASKTPPRRLQDGFRSVENRQGAPRRLQDSPRRLQDAAKTPQDLLKTPPRHLQRCPKTLQRRFQGVPRHLKDAPRYLQETPRRLQEACSISSPRIQREKQHAISVLGKNCSLTQLSHSYTESRVTGQQYTQMNQAYVAENKKNCICPPLMHIEKQPAFIIWRTIPA